MGKKKLLTGRVFLTLAYYLTTTRINQRFFNSTRLDSFPLLYFSLCIATTLTLTLILIFIPHTT